MQTTINEAYLTEFKPNNIDLKKAEEKGLAANSTLTEEYWQLYLYYAGAFWDYTKESIDLRAFDQGLAGSDMRFIPMPEKYQNIYQKYFSFGNQFVYLRNHFCIERLSEEELVQLSNFMTSETPYADMHDFVESTFRQLIQLDENANIDDLFIYDMGTGSHAPNLCFLIEIATGLELGADGRTLSSEHEKEKQEFLKELAPKLAQEIESCIGIPAAVFIR